LQQFNIYSSWPCGALQDAFTFNSEISWFWLTIPLVSLCLLPLLFTIYLLIWCGFYLYIQLKICIWGFPFLRYFPLRGTWMEGMQYMQQGKLII
jgi:hypothetical protein